VESFSHYSGRSAFPEETDIMDSLSPVQWLNRIDEEGNELRVDAYQAHIPREQIISLGDHQLVLVTEPYYDANDQLYIQQFTKVIMNVGGAQTNWYSTLGLPTEIQALKTPYANWVGETFSGIVYSEGEPVPFARLEIDYLNYGVDAENAKFSDTPFIAGSHPSYKYISMMTNERGEFHFGIPAAGWWAIAALGTGPENRLDGTFFSQDAILWIYAEEVPLTPEGRAQ
jgi:cobalt/nickel transport protein